MSDLITIKEILIDVLKKIEIRNIEFFRKNKKQDQAVQNDTEGPPVQSR